MELWNLHKDSVLTHVALAAADRQALVSKIDQAGRGAYYSSTVMGVHPDLTAAARSAVTERKMLFLPPQAVLTCRETPVQD